jgi:outer membrane immunogenic protein
MLRASNLYISIGAIALAIGSTVAFADGLPGSFKDAPVQKSWQGFYIGTNAGLVTGDTQGDTGAVVTNYSVTGAVGGAQLGYNWQRGNQVFGIEGGYDFASVQGNTACAVVLDCRREINSLATVVGRYGLAFGQTLYYGMAGVAWADVDTHVIAAGGVPFLGADAHRFGWIAGFGFEHALSERLTARIEYAHVEFGSDTQLLIGAGPDTLNNVDLKMDTIRLGVNWKLSN